MNWLRKVLTFCSGRTTHTLLEKRISQTKRVVTRHVLPRIGLLDQVSFLSYSSSGLSLVGDSCKVCLDDVVWLKVSLCVIKRIILLQVVVCEG